MTLRLAARLALILLFAISGVAQESAQSPQPKSAIPSTGFAGLDQYRASRIAIFTDDFGQLARYAKPMPPSNRPRPARIALSSSEIPSPTSGISTNISPARLTSTAA